MFRRCLIGSLLLTAAESSSQLLKGKEVELQQLSPRKIADILDTYIVGQDEGKRAVAVALRNRWRRKQLADEDMKREVMPKNILLIGPTGVGKTEISRRMARITDAPFLKVEATKYTEVGFKGKDVEGIIEDLYMNAKVKAKKLLSAQREAEAEAMAIDIVYSNWMARRRLSQLDHAVRNAPPEATVDGGEATAAPAAAATKSKGRRRKKKGDGAAEDDAAAKAAAGSEEAQQQPASSPSPPATPEVDDSLEAFRSQYKTTFKDDMVTVELTAPAPQVPKGFPSSLQGAGDIQWLGALVGMGGDDQKKVKTTVSKRVEDAVPLAKQEALDKLIDENQVKELARMLAQEEGVVFIDEIDKVVAEANGPSSDVSSTGVQQDLLPLVEGSQVTLKDGTVIDTTNVLFICSGAFHTVKTSDMLAELQGRLPVRVELKPLKEKEFRRILTEPKFNLLQQQRELLKTEGMDVVFTEDGIDELAKVTCTVNSQGQNIGARRLNTILERVMDTYSFQCEDYEGQTVTVDAAAVREATEKLVKNMDLAKYLL